MFEKPHNDVLKSIRALGCSEAFYQGNYSPVYKTINGAQIGTDVQGGLGCSSAFAQSNFGPGVNKDSAILHNRIFDHRLTSTNRTVKGRKCVYDQRDRVCVKTSTKWGTRVYPPWCSLNSLCLQGCLRILTVERLVSSGQLYSPWAVALFNLGYFGGVRGQARYLGCKAPHIAFRSALPHSSALASIDAETSKTRFQP